ncbi:hypothetical protein AB0958_23245 [Streptomyces sp. NPDC006655]|uniref:hypothetical protein n=1 Tax=Streptomyces sp. NPDC006655 TaxID=3156898 RepID=UPI003454CE03
MKKASTLLSVAVMALGVVPLAASPASAVQRCEHQEARADDTSDTVKFDFCIHADQNEVTVSVENFKCYGNFFGAYRTICTVRAGVVETLRNGSPTYDQLSPLESGYNSAGYWKASYPGCEEGDFIKAYIDDLQIHIMHELGHPNIWDDESFRYPFMNSGVRC